MKHAILLLLLFLLGGCAHLNLPKSSPEEAGTMLIEGIQSLSAKNSTTPLEKLIERYPESPEAEAARKLLKSCGQKKAKTDNQAELKKLRLENQRLQEDLEKLRKILIKSEKRAS